MPGNSLLVQTRDLPFSWHLFRKAESPSVPAYSTAVTVTPSGRVSVMVTPSASSSAFACQAGRAGGAVHVEGGGRRALGIGVAA